MLEYLRNASEKPVAKILISILAFSFVGWGVAEWIFGGTVGDNTVMHIGKADISVQQYNSEKSRELALMTREQQRAVYADAEAQNDFSQQVLTKIATQQMVHNHANELGFAVSEKRIAQEIRDFPDFQVNGKFSTVAFDNILNNSGYSEAEFANVLRGQILRSMVLGSVSAPVSVSEFAVQAAYNARYGKRDIEYTTVKFADFKVSEPTDKQLQEFYKQNPQTLPETRAVSYVFIETDMSQPDKYDAGYATAVKIEDDIIAGETMKDAAKKHGAKYVSLKSFDRDHRPVDTLLTDSMVTKIFDMEPQLESEMIETKNGFVFVRVDEVKPAHTAEFDTVKKSLTNDWKKAEQKKQAYVHANELLVNLNKKGGSLANKKVATVSRAEGAPAELLVPAFRNKIGQNSIENGTDSFYILSIKKATAPKVEQRKMDNLRKELQNMSATGLQEDFNSFLKREYPVKINEKVYNRVFGK
ncbi:MAG: SurA N-terminal domain-containing protein [Alphaproteobacteria bacterium]|nr:SurA N-terminal domain-containing protein [Alphaproteobacteria bacterium]